MKFADIKARWMQDLAALPSEQWVALVTAFLQDVVDEAPKVRNVDTLARVRTCFSDQPRLSVHAIATVVYGKSTTETRRRSRHYLQILEKRGELRKLSLAVWEVAREHPSQTSD